MNGDDGVTTIHIGQYPAIFDIQSMGPIGNPAGKSSHVMPDYFVEAMGQDGHCPISWKT